MPLPLVPIVVGGIIRLGIFAVQRLAVRQAVTTAVAVAEGCSQALWQAFAVSRGLVSFQMSQVAPRMFMLTSRSFTGTLKVLKDGQVTFMLRSGQLSAAAQAEIQFLLQQANMRLGSQQGLKWVSEVADAARKAGPKAFEMTWKSGG
jgi:hypothetical protein